MQSSQSSTETVFCQFETFLVFFRVCRHRQWKRHHFRKKNHICSAVSSLTTSATNTLTTLTMVKTQQTFSAQQVLTSKRWNAERRLGKPNVLKEQVNNESIKQLWSIRLILLKHTHKSCPKYMKMSAKIVMSTCFDSQINSSFMSF